MKVIVSFLIVISIFFVSCSSKVRFTKEIFDKVEFGMTVKEVTAILGEPVEIKKIDGEETYYYIKNDMVETEYAQVRFDKHNAGVSFKFYGNPL